MTTMRKTWIAAALAAMAAFSGAAHAGAGVFGTYVALDLDAAGPNTYFWYGGLQPGSNLLKSFQGLNIGDYALGSSAWIAGAEVLTWKNSGSDVTGNTFQWAVDQGAWTSSNIGWTANAGFNDAADNTFTGAGDQKWAQLGGTPIDFLSGVGTGQHTLSVRFITTTNGDPIQTGAYTANFSVSAPVPEASTWAMMAAGLGVLAVVARRRRA